MLRCISLMILESPSETPTEFLPFLSDKRPDGAFPFELVVLKGFVKKVSFIFTRTFVPGASKVHDSNYKYYQLRKFGFFIKKLPTFCLKVFIPGKILGKHVCKCFQGFLN